MTTQPGRYFSAVTRHLKGISYMGEARAQVARRLIRECEARDVLELGFYQGKRSCYFAAILEDRGGVGHVTTIDLRSARKRTPNIEENLEAVGLSHRVTPIFAKRSYTWEMARMIKNGRAFDFCYLDGGHTWDKTGFGCVLVDLLLRPGGIVVLDDITWSIAKSIAKNPTRAAQFTRYDEDEIAEPSVKLVWDTIVPRLGYEREPIGELNWGVARKPLR